MILDSQHHAFAVVFKIQLDRTGELTFRRYWHGTCNLVVFDREGDCKVLAREDDGALVVHVRHPLARHDIAPQVSAAAEFAAITIASNPACTHGSGRKIPNFMLLGLTLLSEAASAIFGRNSIASKVSFTPVLSTLSGVSYTVRS